MLISLCQHCNGEIFYKNKNRKPKFCSQSCSGKANYKLNGGVRRKGVIFPKCPICDKLLVNLNSKWCSLECHRTERYRQQVEKIQLGQVYTRKTLRKYVQLTRGYKCESCELSEWMNHKLPLELDHIDGNPANNLPDNLQLLCSNCHSITPFWKGRNKGNGCKSRGLEKSGKPLKNSID